MNDIQFSILIPAYKSAYFGECIESIIAQTYRRFELIIVDDASPEDLETIVRSYNDERIRYYRNETNIGAINVVDNWNKCLSYATGDYVICLGDDDRLLPNCLEEYYELIQKYPSAKIFHGRTELIGEHGDILSILECREEREPTLSFIYYRWKGRYQYIGDYCYERNKLNQLGGYYKLPLAWATDDISAIRQSADEGFIVNSNKILFQYRINQLTITSSGAISYKLEAIREEKSWFEIFLCQYKYKENGYYQLLVKMKEKYFLKKNLDTISLDVSQRPYVIFRYLYKKNYYQLTYAMLAYVFIEGLIIIGKSLKSSGK